MSKFLSILKSHRRTIGYGAAVVLFAVLVSATSGAPALPVGSWGLSFREEGKTPTGNATSEQLAAFDAAYTGKPGENTIYLTFDSGYENGCTAQILDVLKAHDVPAAFFLVGTYMEKNPDLVRRMADEGHIVGNHTQTHPDMSKISDPAAFQQELKAVEDQYFSITGHEMPKFYRPPQGVYSEQNLQMAKDLGYKTVFWSLAYVDWLNDDQPTPEEAFSKLIPRLHDGAIVLLHSTSKTNAAILDELLTRWEDMGYRFGTLEELFSL